MKLVFNKRSGAVVMSLDSEGLGAAVVAGVGSNLTQPSGISYFSLSASTLYLMHVFCIDQYLVPHMLYLATCDQ